MEEKTYQPSADLAPFVEYYWIGHWEVANSDSFETEVLPHLSVDIVITSASAEVAGVATSKSTRSLHGNGVVLGIKFKPGGFYPFYKKPVDRLTNQTLPLSALFTVTRVRRVVAQLTGNDLQIVAEAEKLLRMKRPAEDPNIDAINEIITQIQHDKNLSTVQAVCEKYELSERTLQYVFQRYVGIGLKWIVGHFSQPDATKHQSK